VATQPDGSRCSESRLRLDSQLLIYVRPRAGRYETMVSVLAPKGNPIGSRRRLPGMAAAALATGIAGVALVSPTPAVAHQSSKALVCRASVSDRFPSDDSTVVVYVETVGNAHVATSAYYESTTDTMFAKANRHGRALTKYDVSDATKGYKVIVTVKVKSNSRSGQCRTSYTPE
jgi:hypothetical protein